MLDCSGLTARAAIDVFVSPTLTAIQLPPPSVDLKMPSPLAARTVPGVAGSIQKAVTFVSTPALAGLQLAPPSVLLKIPIPPGKRCGVTPAYTVFPSVGSMATAFTSESVRPVLTAVQLPAPSVLLNTPPPLVAA